MKKVYSAVICAAVIGWAGGAMANDCGLDCQRGQTLIDYSATKDYTPDALMNPGDTKTYTFDLNAYVDPSWDINSNNSIKSASLTFFLYDDVTGDDAEYAKFKWDGVNWTYFEVEGMMGPYNVYNYGWGGVGGYDHTLTYTITNTGSTGSDFYLDKVVLEGQYCGVNPVPEPTTMLLFGAGLASLAAVGRRRKN